MNINPINNHNLTHKGKVTIINKNFAKNEMQALINNEKLLFEYAKNQRFNYVISKNKNEKDIVRISIVDETLKNSFFGCKETLTTKVKNINSAKIFDSMKKLTKAWENKTPFKDLNINEKLTRIFSILTQQKLIL